MADRSNLIASTLEVILWGAKPLDLHLSKKGLNSNFKLFPSYVFWLIVWMLTQVNRDTTTVKSKADSSCMWDLGVAAYRAATDRVNCTHRSESWGQLLPTLLKTPYHS